ncbi:hypothetical protein RCC89_06085 [Cytophagaceae bacterium ABcell3]|nr:hypothetical protein RCC89_06085 [Cytophagaceae bacterium ABcell3]
MLILISGFAYSPAKAQVYDGGEILIDAYYGYPNLLTGFMRTAAEMDVSGNVSVRSFGPGGAKVEYLLTERIGFGVHFNYATSVVEYEEDVTRGGETNTYTYTASAPRWRVMPTINFHMGSSDKVDPYISLGVGYRSSGLEYSTTDPEGDFDTDDINFNFDGSLAYRAEFGIRYFIMDNLGIHTFIGIGGGALSGAGVSVKF